MKKTILLATLITVLCYCSFAQTPQIARVSSSGVTTVYTDLKKAMSDAQDDDFIYLPGGLFVVDSLNFNHRVNVIGAGHYPDSTNATGRTVINGDVYCFAGGTGGSLQGVAFGNVNYGSSCMNFTIAKCYFSLTQGLNGDQYASTAILNIYDCIVYSALFTGNNPVSFGIIANKSLINDITFCNNSTFSNCVFYNYGMYGNNYGNDNDELRNCIFNIVNNGSSTSGTIHYFNSHIENMTSGCSFNHLAFALNTTYDSTAGNTFVGGACPTTFSYTFDYHVKASSNAAGSGTDGTDKGIYGTMYPYNPLPYNPHIYFNSVAPVTNAQGQLPMNVKVRAQ